MVILLCSTPRRGMIAVATHGTPNVSARVNSKRPLLFTPLSARSGSPIPPDSHYHRMLSEISSKPIGQEDEEEEREELGGLRVASGHRSRLDIASQMNMSTTPTYGHSCFPFAVNCRFSKTFFGVPKKCGYCQKIIVGTGFACQNCRFRCHKKCIMIGRGPQVCLRPKPCSLSRLPPGDEALINKLLRESEINCNDIDSVFTEDETEDDAVDGGHSTSAPQCRPSTATSSSIAGTIRSVAPSLTTSDEPSSCPPSPPSVSPSVSSPSSPTYPSSGITESSNTSREYLRPIGHVQIQKKRRPHSRHQQQQRNGNMLLLALASGVERRPSTSSTSSSKRRQGGKQCTPVGSPVAPVSSGLMDRFLKLIPSWHTPNSKADSNAGHTDTTLRSASVASAASSVSMAAYSCAGEQEKEASQTLPRAVSASAAMASMVNAGFKRPVALSICSTTSNGAYSGSGSVRTPVDEFNSSILEDLFCASQPANATNATCTTNGTACNTRQSQFLRRRLLWAKHMAGDRTARSQDCVHGGDPALGGNNETGEQECCGTMPDTNRKGSAIVCDEGLGNRGANCVEDCDDPDDASDVVNVRERLANTWPMPGLHINHDESNVERADEIGNVDMMESMESCDVQECIEEEDSSERGRHRRARLSDLGEWTIPYSDLEFGECINECRNMTTYKGRWHGDVMIHTVDMTGGESDRLMHNFLDNVRTLTKIRHENVALFMGASIETPLVAVVTSIRKGCSLYDAVHVENRRISQHAKLNIVRQVAQGMGYLHAKGIILKTLTSRSIYLESKVKISTLDDGAPLKQHDIAGVGCIRRGHLTYISPELMQTLRVEPPALTVSGTPTKETDVYAFGTVLFELYAGDFPFAHLAPESIVWTIGTGGRQDLERVRCNVAMKSLIEDCWSPDPSYRPSFTEVLKELQHTAALHKKHSSSVPENLNKTGFHRSIYNY